MICCISSREKEGEREKEMDGEKEREKEIGGEKERERKS